MPNTVRAVFGGDLLYICICISEAKCSQDKAAMHQNFNVVLIGEHWLYFYPTWGSSSGWAVMVAGGCSQTIWCMDCCSQHINIQSGPHHYQHQHWLTTKYINKQLALASPQLTFKVKHQSSVICWSSMTRRGNVLFSLFVQSDLSRAALLWMQGRIANYCRLWVKQTLCIQQARPLPGQDRSE